MALNHFSSLFVRASNQFWITTSNHLRFRCVADSRAPSQCLVYCRTCIFSKLDSFLFFLLRDYLAISVVVYIRFSHLVLTLFVCQSFAAALVCLASTYRVACLQTGIDTDVKCMPDANRAATGSVEREKKRRERSGLWKSTRSEASLTSPLIKLYVRRRGSRCL